MSYCRKGKKSDVYLYASAYGGFQCCDCVLEEVVTDCGLHRNASFTTLREAWQHLLAHCEAGHEFPGRALHRIQLDADEHGWDWENSYDGEFI